MDVIGIYVIRQCGTDRCYVGSSRTINARWKGHRYDLNRGRHRAAFLQRAWTKHGESAFVFEIVETCSVDMLLVREQHFIDTLNPVFNTAKVAGTRRGVPQSPDAIEKVRRVHLGRKNSPATIARMSIAQMGHQRNVGNHHSDETKRKIAAAHKGKSVPAKANWRDPQARIDKIIATQKGKPRPWQIGVKRSRATRRKIAAALRGNRNGCK